MNLRCSPVDSLPVTGVTMPEVGEKSRRRVSFGGIEETLVPAEQPIEDIHLADTTDAADAAVAVAVSIDLNIDDVEIGKTVEVVMMESGYDDDEDIPNFHGQSVSEDVGDNENPGVGVLNVDEEEMDVDDPSLGSGLETDSARAPEKRKREYTPPEKITRKRLSFPDKWKVNIAKEKLDRGEEHYNRKKNSLSKLDNFRSPVGWRVGLNVTAKFVKDDELSCLSCSGRSYGEGSGRGSI